MQLIVPATPLFAQIGVVSSTRLGGVSPAPYDQLNLGDHVGDAPANVATNRQRLLTQLGLAQAQWLEQIHSTDWIQAQADGQVRTADACWSDQPGLACVVMTADCLPVVFSDGERVAVAHAGWRGLAGGILEHSTDVFKHSPPKVWLGPAIGAARFEVGEDVRQVFCDTHPGAVTAFIPAASSGKWLADIYALARLRLRQIGIEQVSGGEYCTYRDAEQFYSYRRNPVTGRMATIVWRRA